MRQCILNIIHSLLKANRLSLCRGLFCLMIIFLGFMHRIGNFMSYRLSFHDLNVNIEQNKI